MDPSALTLGAWYEQHFLPLYHADARPGTIEAYRNTISVWTRLSGNPPLTGIDAYTLAQFRAACTCTPATIAKHARHLNHLLAKLGPPGPRNRDALGLLPQAPWCKPPKHDHDPKRIPSTDELSQFVAAAPDDLALFAVLAATTGTRNDAIRDLTPDAVDASAQIIRFPAHTDKRRRVRLKPIPAITLKWLQTFAPLMDRWKTQPGPFARRWNPRRKGRHAAVASARSQTLVGRRAHPLGGFALGDPLRPGPCPTGRDRAALPAALRRTRRSHRPDRITRHLSRKTSP